jgi:hypothetical protein
MQVQALSKAIQNDQWITGFEEDVSDPDILPDIPGYQLKVKLKVVFFCQTRQKMILPILQL